MKLIIGIIQDEYINKLSRVLLDKKIRTTKLASTGGFLKSGSTTLLMGVKQEDLDDVMDLVRSVCTSKKQEKDGKEVVVGGANLFILDVNQFIRL